MSDARHAGSIRLNEIDKPFCLDKILDGTQDFRWRRLKGARWDGWHSGVLDSNTLHLRQLDGAFQYRAHSNLDGLLARYFRLGEDIAATRESLAACDATMAALIREFPYMRLLRQPNPWETMASYICSIRNGVQNIARLTEKIAAMGPAMELDGETRPAFPSPEVVLDAGIERIRSLGLGLTIRPVAIFEASQRIGDGRLDFDRLASPQATHTEARRSLMECHGIGPKMSNCIAVFTLDKPHAFPIDRHIRSSMRRYYFPGKSITDLKMTRFAQERFRKRAGYAAQLLFLDDYEKSKRQRTEKPRRQRSRRRR